jgi:hypothetical protein
VRLTRSASVLVSFKATLVSPLTRGLEGCSLSDSTITSGEGGLLSGFMSLWDRYKGSYQRVWHLAARHIAHT